MSLSQFPAFNWNHNTQSYLLHSLSQGSEIMVSASCLSDTKTALQPCTLCLGQETAALKLPMTDPRNYCWHYVSLALEDDLGDPSLNLMPWWATNPKSSSCCSRSCCPCHHARDIGTNKINICPVMRTSLTLSSSNTRNPLGVGMEKKLHVVFTFKNCPARNNSLLSFPLHQQN